MSTLPDTLRDPATLRLLRCPATGRPLRLQERNGEAWLVSDDGAVRYPIEDGVPVLLAERGVRGQFSPSA